MARSSDDWPAIAAALSGATRRTLHPQPAHGVHGGCIAESVRWETNEGPLFVKLADIPDGGAMLEAEAAGLDELRGAEAVRVPKVLAVGATGERAYLALEWIDLAQGTAQAEATLGERLAWQHRASAPQFGWTRDNAIGSTPQLNTPQTDWVRFFRDQRLAFQLARARANGHGGALQERGALLLEMMGAFFSSHRPVPSLLHGDLWGGNWSADTAGEPVIFDPAVYYGDREADIAMTRLFGGFGHAFYTAYQSAWPLDQAAGSRRALYNLYHVLNHLNLFGGGYRDQALGSIERLLAELGH